jgi:hypothetical protein
MRWSWFRSESLNLCVETAEVSREAGNGKSPPGKYTSPFNAQQVTSVHSSSPSQGAKPQEIMRMPDNENIGFAGTLPRANFASALMGEIFLA